MWTVGDIKGNLAQKIQQRSARVAVVGLGYVGLPFAVEKGKVGFHVVGIEGNPGRVAEVNAGRSYIPDVATSEVAELVEKGLLTATSDFSVVKDCDVIVIAVPTPLTKNLTPDLHYVESVTLEVANYLRPGQLVSLESTTYPGTTDEVMLPALSASGLKPDQDFFLVHSPERVDPGNKRYTTKNTTKVVGGVGPNSTEIGSFFYAQTISRVVSVSNSKSAELVKVFENTFRAVNIALVNELTLLCDKLGISVWEVLDAAFTKPFGIMPFYPGPGVGGHCIPLDPHYLEWKAKEHGFNTHFIALAGEINRGMPAFVCEKVRRVLNRHGIAPSRAKVLALGVAYKKDIGDFRESPSVEVIRQLKADGVTLSYHDPFVPNFKEHYVEMEGRELTESLLAEQDLVIILTDHSNIDYQWVLDRSKAVLDTRNATRGLERGKEKVELL